MDDINNLGVTIYVHDLIIDVFLNYEWNVNYKYHNTNCSTNL